MKTILAAALVVGAATGIAATAQAQAFPTQPITLIVGFAAGSTTDNIARYYVQAMSEQLSEPLIVLNRPGASQIAAITELLQSDADGHTLMMVTGSAGSQGPGVRDDLPYETLVDFVPVAMLADAAGVFVANNNLPFDTIGEMVAYAQEHPGELNYGSSGLGSASNLQFELLRSITDIDMVHIPYQGSSQIMNALMAGEVDVGLSPIQGALPLVTSGSLKAIGVTGSEPVEGMPSAQPLSTSEVPGLSVLDPYTYYLIVAPAGTPEAVIEQLHDAFNAATASEQTSAALVTMGFRPLELTIEEARERVEADVAVWREFRERTGFQWGQ